MSVRILIVDNKTSLRLRIKETLLSASDFVVLGEATDGYEAILKTRELRPDVVIMDVGMPGMNGLTATQQIKEEMPEVRIIILTVYDLPEYKAAALQRGASGYVIKTAMVEELVPTIEAVLGIGRSDVDSEGGEHGAGKATESLSEGSARDEFEELVVREKVKIMRGVSRGEAEPEQPDDAG